MSDNDNDYSQQTNTGSRFIQDLTLINVARAGVIQDLSNSEKTKREITKVNEKLASEVAANKKKAQAAQEAASSLQGEVGNLNRSLIMLRREVLRLNNLLNSPLEEIAKQHPVFSEKYEKKMELIAEWMLSQKGFKEVAIQFGIERGLSANEVIQMGHEKKLDVLDNKHNSEHGTNANDIPLIEMKSDKLRAKVIEQIGVADKDKALLNMRTMKTMKSQINNENKVNKLTK